MKFFETKAEATVEQLTYVAWRVATLSRAKTIPPLKSLLSKIKSGRKPKQTPEQQMAIIQMWNGLLGGRVTNKTEH